MYIISRYKYRCGLSIVYKRIVSKDRKIVTLGKIVAHALSITGLIALTEITLTDSSDDLTINPVAQRDGSVSKSLGAKLRDIGIPIVRFFIR